MHALKLWLILLALVVSVPPAVYSAPAPRPTSSAVARGHGLLWKIKGAGDPPSYVFGTIHIADPRVTHLPPPVRQAFDHARSFTMEVRMDYQAYAQVIQGMYYHDGRTLQSVIGPALFAQVVRAMKPKGFDRAALMSMKPWAVMSAAGLPGIKPGVALDLQLYTKALNEAKPVYGLETAQEQVAVFDGMSHEAQVEMIKGIIQGRHEDDGLMQELLKAYLARDLNRLLVLEKQDTKSLSPAVARAFYRRLIVERNLRMVRRMQPRLHAGGAFIAVGALHLPGKQGILHLLENRGYRVTPVY